jgi:hypothetical protein
VSEARSAEFESVYRRPTRAERLGDFPGEPFLVLFGRAKSAGDAGRSPEKRDCFASLAMTGRRAEAPVPVIPGLPALDSGRGTRNQEVFDCLDSSFRGNDILPWLCSERG